MRKWLTILCLLVFSIQLLPLRQVGSLLYSNQLTEELPHSFGAEKSEDIKFEPVRHDYFDNIAPATLFSEENYRHFASTLPDNHEGEIQTPPPNI
ncbi:hypothetical protein [Foetidibacter luteolus]|uniref:hypothetical protein n=1 Tax=Foetidibacter luteolus TaxID=2608880 RepID=UPI00129B21BB|nr:hypothetical protein [Foetidibacter luteolus]